MKRPFYLLLLLIAAQASAAGNIERKIIIENNRFYYSSIDEKFQIATLHMGNIFQPLDSAELFALPVGRNYDYPINPLSWDLCNGIYYGISFLSHPLNDRNEALKCFPVSSLEKWSNEITMMYMLMKSVDQNMFAINEPYKYITTKSNILDHFFFDGIAMNDSSYVMAICNNNDISIWNYNKKKWQHGPDQKFMFDDYFSLLKFDEQFYLVASDGSIFLAKDYNITLVKNKSLGDFLINCIIIENRDNNTISVMRNSQLDFGKPLDKQISKSAIKLF